MKEMNETFNERYIIFLIMTNSLYLGVGVSHDTTKLITMHEDHKNFKLAENFNLKIEIIMKITLLQHS